MAPISASSGGSVCGIRQAGTGFAVSPGDKVRLEDQSVPRILCVKTRLSRVTPVGSEIS